MILRTPEILSLSSSDKKCFEKEIPNLELFHHGFKLPAARICWG